MKTFLVLLALISSMFCFAHGLEVENKSDIVIENEQVRFIIGSNGTAKSLLYKLTNEECLIPGINMPVFSVTQERPFHNEIKLAYPTQEMTFNAKSVKREGDELIIDFELIFYKARVKVDITPSYINFTVMEFFIDDNDYGLGVNKGILPPVYKMNFIQLPVREREYFGEWLNVSWDTDLAINVLATDIHARVDAENRDGYRVMRAAVEREVKLLDVSAALIVCKTDDLLDNIAQLEEDFNLPRGVNSRRNKLYNSSYYDATNVNPSNVEEHIKYAKMGGFRSMKIRYRDIVESAPSWGKNGDFDWRASIYPNGSEDLKLLLETIKSEGITPGLHFLPSSRTIGTQPDMIEYATSLAAAWDCPVSLNASLESFKNHARTADNLEVFRRWEEVRAKNWLTEEQKRQLRDVNQEYHLLLNEQNQFELHPYEQITTVAGGNEEIRAFLFQREGVYHVVYWHISGNKKLELPLDGKNVALYRNIDREEKILSTRNGDIVVPADDRKYLKISNVSKEKIFEAFENARIFE